MNPHTLTGTRSLVWRVCQFRHSDVLQPTAEAIDNCSAPATRSRNVSRLRRCHELVLGDCQLGRFRPLTAGIHRGPAVALMRARNAS